MKKHHFQWIEPYRQPLIVFSGLTLFSMLFVWVHFSGKEKKATADSHSFQISDMIPDGFVMIPVELENHSSINDLITSFGVVDLYQTQEEGRPHKLAQAVRIVRLETGKFSVLIPENSVGDFVQHQSLGLHAVVQNSNKKDSQIIPPRVKRKRFIFVDEEPAL